MTLHAISTFSGRKRDGVAICGGGIAGLALATLLARAGHRLVVFEARDEATALSEGAFLTLAPNGMSALSAIGVSDKVSARGMPTKAIEIANHRGRRLALLDLSDEANRCGHGSVTIKRGVLGAILAEAAREAGAELRFGMRLSSAVEDIDGIALSFADGSSQRFDIAAACDGLTSRMRQCLFPEAPLPSYTGLTGTGGMIDAPDLPATNGVMRMTFGRKAYFGYIKEGDGPVFWFNSYTAAKDEGGRVTDPEAHARIVRDLHAGDPAPIPQIVAALNDIPRSYPIHDMPPLSTWHTSHAVLVGDAAHAVAPHAGQGASMALEDTVVLAACLRDEPFPQRAFARFEMLRKERTRQVMEIARRNGSRKMTQGALAIFLRDLALPLLIPLGLKASRRIAEFRVDREPLAAPPL